MLTVLLSQLFTSITYSATSQILNFRVRHAFVSM